MRILSFIVTIIIGLSLFGCGVSSTPTDSSEFLSTLPIVSDEEAEQTTGEPQQAELEASRVVTSYDWATSAYSTGGTTLTGVSRTGSGQQGRVKASINWRIPTGGVRPTQGSIMYGRVYFDGQSPRHKIDEVRFTSNLDRDDTIRFSGNAATAEGVGYAYPQGEAPRRGTVKIQVTDSDGNDKIRVWFEGREIWRFTRDTYYGERGDVKILLNSPNPPR